MYLHILNDNKYSDKFIEFIKNNFSNSLHTFVTFSKQPKYLDRGKVEIVDISKLSQIRWLYKKISNADKVFLHSLFRGGKSLMLFLFNRKNLSKTYWVIWGGDLYNYWLKDSHSVREKVLERLKRKLIKNIYGIVALVQEDYLFAKEKYKTKAKYYYAFYPNPVDFKMLDTFSDQKNRKEKTILIGNSAAPSNNHFEILDALYENKLTDTKIICPLSYGSSQEYVKKVYGYGVKLFGENFIALTEFLSAEEYAEILANVDVAIFAHRRQQALGNILALLYLGKKVYIRSDISSWSFFNRLGIRIFDTKNILDGSEKDIFTFEEKIAKKNREKVLKEFSEERCVQLWKNVFESKLNGGDM
ncbi:TDP-N-acetylfucosamine:lipid II N-acetylfucosaminyltransferase [Thermosipho globiformans]|uniref:TDP-N-acetylfucosamine:lipid II N-acetylfucosaminyltransferase n=1 Tax=Thermosipho globiformans TaxID=380685 RepID=UPI000F8E8800|nr:TDP-N-acetylfucosamine:lipid II N-acetylfucosaminyltransferase [Thermosipho globiformans]